MAGLRCSCLSWPADRKEQRVMLDIRARRQPPIFSDACGHSLTDTFRVQISWSRARLTIMRPKGIRQTAPLAGLPPFLASGLLEIQCRLASFGGLSIPLTAPPEHLRPHPHPEALSIRPIVLGTYLPPNLPIPPQLHLRQ
jgi:hypothetical protein